MGNSIPKKKGNSTQLLNAEWINPQNYITGEKRGAQMSGGWASLTCSCLIELKFGIASIPFGFIFLFPVPKLCHPILVHKD